MRIPRVLVPALLLVLPLAGCVERKFMIRSDPEGARVRVNGVFRGTTPFEIPFNDYGVVRLESEPMDPAGDGFPEFEGITSFYELEAPWYQWFPFDFFTDNLWPGTLQVRREICLVLPRALDPDDVEDTKTMRAKIPGIRVRAGQMRFEQEAAPPVEEK